MTDANKNLVLRIVSALVLLPGVLGLLWLGDLPFAGLVGAGAALIAYEVYTIAFKRIDPALAAGMLCAAAIPIGYGVAPDRLPHFVTFGAAALLIGAYAWYLIRGPLAEAPVRVAMLFTGVFYAGLLLTGAVALRALPQGFWWVFLAMAVTFMNDTGAYAAGRAMGRHKLYPAVSPGKTWEGLAGGTAGSVAAAFIVKALFFPELSAIDCLAVAIPCSALGPIGDLSESMLKRAYGVKDSGRLIPGHGGMLDRVDALLFNLPYIWLYAALIR